MNGVSTGFYDHARTSVRRQDPIREDASPPERWMQQIWRHQRLHRDRLRTLDGQPVTVLHPGFWNRESGPDFKQAVIQIGNEPARRGDVELDRVIGGWRSHRHAGNPAYEQVILHVVWTAPAAGAGPPVMAMAPFLDTPLNDLVPWLENEAPGLLPANLPGRCCGPLGTVDGDQFHGILNQAAAVRLRRKADDLATRARQAGWDQALWEGLVAGLGYKHNTWPMRRLAELTPIESGTPRTEPTEAFHAIWEARMLGLSGLLPAQLPKGDARISVRQLWDLWWRERDAWADRELPSFVWRLDGVRPANHPQRRVILAARWRAAGSFSRGLEAWQGASGSPSALRFRLLTLLTPPPIPGDYWQHHATWRSRSSSCPMPLLGTTRLTELALNVILPWLHARAREAGDDARCTEVETRFFQWPAGGDNSALKLARQRLFGGTARIGIRTGAAQQGLHQILCDFCQHAGPLCDACQFPSVVRSLGMPAHPPVPGEPPPAGTTDSAARRDST